MQTLDIVILAFTFCTGYLIGAINQWIRLKGKYLGFIPSCFFGFHEYGSYEPRACYRCGEPYRK